MKAIEIREARAEDAKALLTYLRRIGGESDNLTFDNQGLPFTEEEESRFLESVHRDPRSIQLVGFSEKDEPPR